MIVFGDDRLDLVSMCGKQAAVFVRICGSVPILGLEMGQIPDAVVHGLRVVIDERNLLG